jgi:enamine deaminase RidA (YjgF/YER057c/UK114 family)
MLSLPNRRTFLRDSLLVTTGVCAGAAAPWAFRRGFENEAIAADQPGGSDYDKRLKELGLELPAQSKPVAVYVPAVITGNLLYTSGHIPRTADGKFLQGRVGADMTVQQGAEAARTVGLAILTTVRESLGSLNRVVRLVKVLGMVNCTPDFKDQPMVINGFSDLMVQLFGEQAGKGARSAVGMGSLPGNVPVEIEAIFEIRPARS